MEQKFLEFVAGVMGVSDDELSLDTAYKEYAPWDSLMFLRLVMEIEERYGVSVAMEDFENIHTLRDFFGMLNDD